MKVKCINNRYEYNNWKFISLTIGKIYDVFEIIRDCEYLIINDHNMESSYPKECFTSLSEIRNDTINKLLEDES